MQHTTGLSGRQRDSGHEIPGVLSANQKLSRNRLLGSVGSVLTFVADAAPGLAHDIIINEECELILRWRRLATRESPRTAAGPIHSCAGHRREGP